MPRQTRRSPDLAVSLALPGGQVGLDGHQQSLVRDRGLRSPAAGGRRWPAAGISWRRTRNAKPKAADPLEAVGQTRPGEVAALIAATSAAPKGRTSPSWPPAVPCMINSPIRFMAMSFHRIALAFLRGMIPAIAFSRHCSSRKISTPAAATKVPPARHAKAAGQPHAFVHPGQVPAGLPAKPGPGKTWTSQARPRLPQAHQQQLCSQNCRYVPSSLDTSIKPILCPRIGSDSQKTKPIHAEMDCVIASASAA